MIKSVSVDGRPLLLTERQARWLAWVYLVAAVLAAVLLVIHPSLDNFTGLVGAAVGLVIIRDLRYAWLALEVTAEEVRRLREAEA